MTIATRADLIAAVTDWLDLGTTISDARVSTFIQLAEARMNRLLRDPEMEVTSNVVAAGALTALPADYGSMVSISTGNGRLDPVGPVEFASFSSVSGTPRYYTIVDNSIGFGPSNLTAQIAMVYRRRIPALSVSNATNWLLTLAPDAYLYGALLHAKGFLSEDDMATCKAMFDEAIEELKIDAQDRKWGAGGLRPRIRRS